MRTNDNPPTTARLPAFDESMAHEFLRAAGLKRLSPVWAKLEIVLGLATAVGGLKLLLGYGLSALGGGALMVLGGYLAMAGHRSHLYQSQNRQTAYLAQILAGLRRYEDR